MGDEQHFECIECGWPWPSECVCSDGGTSRPVCGPDCGHTRSAADGGGEVVDLDTQRPHAVLLVRCKACGNTDVSVCDIRADFSRLECSKCGAQDSEWTFPDD